jgi:DNA-directed RNA polymerase subunit RPC12/RpoP
MAPFRCKRCARRFHARVVTLRYVRYARCGICGNLGLQKISPEHVQSPMAILGRILGLPALRCDPCRHKFFAIRPVIEERVLLSPASRDRAA